MFSFFENTFSVIEWLSVTGLAQCVLILVYIVFRVRDWRQASLALAYFLVLGMQFGLQFSLRIEEYEAPLRLALWFSRVIGPPLCYLLVLQVARGSELPPKKQFFVLLLPALAWIAAVILRHAGDFCDKGDRACPNFTLWLYWVGGLSGSLIMLALWAHKDLFSTLRKAKGGMERYWLVLVLIVANMGMIVIGFLQAFGELEKSEADALLVVLGLAFIYLAITTLFRVYPAPVQLATAPARFTASALTPEERELAARIRKLMEVDKVYHEHTFSRADLARELNVSENILSRVINVSFGKSFPQLLNEFRVEDAKRMLKNPEIPVQVVASEVGFNSVASFNRVFRDISGLNPSQYRQTAAETENQLKT